MCIRDRYTEVTKDARKRRSEAMKIMAGEDPVKAYAEKYLGRGGAGKLEGRDVYWLGNAKLLLEYEAKKVISGKGADKKDLEILGASDAAMEILGNLSLIHIYLIIQEDYRTGKEYGLRFPESRKSGEKYDLRYLQREDSGKVAVLFDIYGEGILLRSEVWICTPSEGRAEMIYEEEVSDGGEPIELFADSRGILLLHFESMGRGTDMTLSLIHIWCSGIPGPGGGKSPGGRGDGRL